MARCLTWIQFWNGRVRLGKFWCLAMVVCPSDPLCWWPDWKNLTQWWTSGNTMWTYTYVQLCTYTFTHTHTCMCVCIRVYSNFTHVRVCMYICFLYICFLILMLFVTRLVDGKICFRSSGVVLIHFSIWDSICNFFHKPCLRSCQPIVICYWSMMNSLWVELCTSIHTAYIHPELGHPAPNLSGCVAELHRRPVLGAASGVRWRRGSLRGMLGRSNDCWGTTW